MIDFIQSNIAIFIGLGTGFFIGMILALLYVLKKVKSERQK
ncbi:hypothetical protein [Photobacterium pectinilyticum]|nr:hypothetical protein [Photobacterium sp. ZSDE20]